MSDEKPPVRTLQEMFDADNDFDLDPAAESSPAKPINSDRAMDDDLPPNHIMQKSQANSAGINKQKAVSASDGKVKPTDRFQYYRMLQSFAQAIGEAEPLYLGFRSMNPDATGEDLKRGVAQYCASHMKLVDACLEDSKIESSDIMIRYWKRVLSKKIANLYRMSGPSDVARIIDLARSTMIEGGEFDDVQMDEISPDSLLSVKLSLHNSSMAALVTLNGLWAGNDQGDVVNTLQRVSMALAREVAFDWSKRADIADKELLFKSVIGSCFEAAEFAYRELLSEELPAVSFIEHDPGLTFPSFELTVDEMDVGYVDGSRIELQEKIRRLVHGYLRTVKPPRLEGSDLLRWRSAYVEGLDAALADSWQVAATDFIGEIMDMEPEERDAFMADNSAMPFVRFTAVFQEALENLPDPLANLVIDLDLIESRAKSHMAWIWAISDSLIAARKEGTPEDYR